MSYSTNYWSQLEDIVDGFECENTLGKIADYEGISYDIALRDLNNLKDRKYFNRVYKAMEERFENETHK